MARHIKTGIRSLKTPGPGAVAHMSLHQKPTMSKSRPNVRSGQLSIPDLHRGTGYPFYIWRPMLVEPGKPGSAASVTGHIWRGVDSVNRLFAILLRTP